MLVATEIDRLAPDSASQTAGRGLAKPAKWECLARQETILWGKCQGSGKDPYLVRVDFGNPLGYKCTCPSRKQPCKHILALLYLLASHPQAYATDTAPDWVEDWLGNRRQQAERAQAKAAAKAAGDGPDTEAQARRIAAREEKVGVALAELRAWLEDVARQGMAKSALDQPEVWERTARRLVDGQCGALARRLQRMQALLADADGESLLARELSRMYLLLEAYGRQADLPEGLREEVRSLVGWTQEQASVLAQPGVRDIWCCLHASEEVQEDIVQHKAWLLGCASGRYASLLQFAHQSQAHTLQRLRVGTFLEGELCYFPSATPQRALIKAHAPVNRLPSWPVSGDHWAPVLERAARTWGLNPWENEIPALLTLRVHIEDGRLWLVDAAAQGLPARPCLRSGMHRQNLSGWTLAALSGGRPRPLFLTWNGSFAQVWSCQDSSQLIPLS